MIKHRQSVAAAIISTLTKALPNAAVSLRGSVAAGTDDGFSDIDILVEHSTATDAAIADEVVRAMYKKHSVLFHDFAKGFLPDECVVSFFVDGLALHTMVEVAMVVAEDNRLLTPDAVQQKHPEHFIKMWVIASKKVARQQKNFELSYLGFHLLPNQRQDDVSAIELLGLTLAVLSPAVNGKYPGLFQKCENCRLNLEALALEKDC